MTVRTPTAGRTAGGVQKTAAQGAGVSVTGLLQPLGSTATTDFGPLLMTATQPSQIVTALANRDRFQVGGVVEDVTMTNDGSAVAAGPFYILGLVEYRAGLSVDSCLVLVDTQAPTALGGALGAF